MDGGGPMPTSGSKRFPRSQKLKDTCDMCSASKVRCNKEKPICSRCEQLGYPCFYSPARRMGRPHPPRRTQPQNKPEATEESERQPTKHSTNQPTHETVEPEPNAPPSVAHISLEPDSREKTINKLPGSGNDFSNDAVLDFCGSGISHNGQSQTEPYLRKESPPRVRQQDQGEDTAMFNFHDQVNRANSTDVDGLYCQAMSSDELSILIPNTSRHSSSTSSTLDQWSVGSAYGGSSASNTSSASESDCATVAMNMLQHLNTTSMERLSSGTSIGELDVSSLDALINTVSMAIKRVSTILVCPCSQKTDVGLLAAAVCAAILDIYGVIFRNSIRSRVQCSSTDKPAYTTMFSVNDVTGDASMIELGTGSLQEGPDAKVTIMRVLEELSKVANLVMQFTKRYSQDAEDCSPDFLPALAASLKSRLKSMTNEATNWLAQV
ncbi:hypothetical protein MMC30_003726 [Trapelia coarctata]|nr:hypothetical protein [Trapelia coarctata]